MLLCGWELPAILRALGLMVGLEPVVAEYLFSAWRPTLATDQTLLAGLVAVPAAAALHCTP